MLLPICNVTVQREPTPFTRTVPHRSNIHHRKLTPVRTEPYYRSNVHHRELMLIIRTEIYRSNWTRDVNEMVDLQEENAYLRERIDELNRQLDNANGEKGKNTVRDSGDEMEIDEEKARIYNIVSHHPQNASNWTYVEQNTLADTDFYEPETPIQMMENLIMAEDVKVLAKMDKIEVIENSELTGIEESEPMEELELMGMKESELIGVEELLKTEDEIDKWYKFVL
ncbi:hypothetical protein GLOIN_2v1781591 [Rhizophagus irregularis DAOM 181602=DAOM 197198]|uniref:Uncharacterized protein n=3 Tax=Rhizophagus irregularis TaxID=588596 RepID=A0A2P4PJG8_RHIID|nr:hypothetical protein GLOIN_2v1781591 [Rhizophagus irregularis DAOM 181602=DAOM 197198]POG65533.1 hypothetical protein GLOIN_2v1781591 [Rhizophagus irregularis DAOM 181602=DAOM 197198]GBC51195.2 hypothetical protein GLOIN_2v1781591 [Rhizophagus irregularis DAOM 181602=DAOM 197198]|eukprot:XP_025172399.1 hypothetical protein GLOIN_2v1781591 [Rhizophagus irregularis DAOM 181602=DAOM 197198]